MTTKRTTIGDPMKRTTHTTFQRYGIPLGLIDHGYPPIYIAQDAFTRQHHVVTSEEFIALASGAWRTDEVRSMAFTGSIATIDPPTQTVSHICDDLTTTPQELANLDLLIVEHLCMMAEPNIQHPA